MSNLLNLLVLLGLVTSNIYESESCTVTASYLTQKGYNTQSWYINIDDNDIDKIDPNAFNGYDKLIDFFILSNSLRSIDMDVFKYTVNLKDLTIDTPSLNKFTNSKNTILPSLTEFTLTSNLTSLNKAMFNGFPALLKFDIGYGYYDSGIIKTIDVHTFESFSNLTYIDLRNNSITSFEYLKIPKNLRSLDLGWNRMNYFALSRTMGVLTELYINDNRFRSFKSMDFTFLANLTRLYLSNNPHAYPYEIAGHMKPLVKLEYVKLVNLNITYIDSNYFKKNTKLQYIDLSLNKISRLDSGAFKGLNDLNYVILYNNNLTKIASGTFNNLNLNSINLANNQISQIDSLSFYGQATNPNNYLYVNLEYNKLTKILPKTFNNRFSFIILSYNEITEIENTTFDGISEVKSLSLSNNKIAKIAPGSFNNLGLYDLDLSNNDLTAISLGSFGKMHLLFLSNNRIEKIDKSAFNYTSIESISLKNNSLTQINKTTFAGQNELNYINLNNNNLSTIESGSFANLTSLTTIYLENNQLTQLDSSMFAGSNNINGIYLRGNPNLSTTNIQSLCPPAATKCQVYY